MYFSKRLKSQESNLKNKRRQYEKRNSFDNRRSKENQKNNRKKKEKNKNKNNFLSKKMPGQKEKKN